MKKSKKNWVEEISSEIKFWDKWIVSKGEPWTDDYWTRLNKETPIQPFIAPYVNKNEKVNRILDVGAGPLTVVGKKHDLVQLEIVSVDPLADEYKKLLKKHNILPLVETQKLDGEQLSTQFEANYFDITFSRNALDHSYDPVEIIRQMVRATKKGGYIILQLKIREGSFENWQGLHGWDFFIGEGELFLEDRRKRRINISKKIYLSANTVELKEENGWIIAVFRKRTTSIAKKVLSFIAQNPHQMILALFVCMILGITIVWLTRNTQLPAYDPAWYLEMSQHMYRSLIENGLVGFWDSYIHAFRLKAPLVSVVPIPFYLIFGNYLLTPYIPNIIAIVLFNIYLFKFTHLLTKERTIALLSCIITSTFPLTVGLSREIMVEYFIMTLTVVWLYYLMRDSELRSSKQVVLLGILLGAGLLYKVLFPLYIFLPTSYLMLTSYKTLGTYQRKAMRKRVWLMLTIATLIALTWYYNNILYVGWFVLTGVTGTVAIHYYQDGLTFLKLFVNNGIGIYYTGLLLILIILGIIKRIISRTKNVLLKPIPLLILWMVPILFFFTTIDRVIRFLTPFTPAIGILLAISFWYVFGKINKKICAAIAAIVLLFPFYNILYSSFPQIPGRDIVRNGYVLTTKVGYSVYPPRTQDWLIEEITGFIYRDSINNKKQSVSIVLTPSTGEFNHNNFRYVALWKGYNNTLNRLDFGGFARDTLENYMKRLDGRPDYIIYYSQTPLELNWLNQFNDVFEKKMLAGELPYHEVGRFFTPQNKDVIIYKINS